MSAIAIMAEKLREEFRMLGVDITLLACIRIIRSCIDHASEVEKKTHASELEPSR